MAVVSSATDSPFEAHKSGSRLTDRVWIAWNGHARSLTARVLGGPQGGGECGSVRGRMLFQRAVSM